MKQVNPLLLFILIIGSLYHIGFFHLNDILKVADSFAYLQMSHFLGNLSQQGLGNGWFGFIYSLPITLLDVLLDNDFLSAKIINIILFNISALILWKISRKVLSQYYSYLVIILFFLSPTLLHFNIHVLSENIYIPLFLGLFLCMWNFIDTFTSSPSPTKREEISQIIYIACILGLMYLTRAEAFIYIGSIGIIALTLLIQKKLSFFKFLGLGTIFFLTFFVFISPYLFHLHSLTGEWGLTNKGASNLRQAELRGIERMDDAGFEQAVAELTPDNTQLIAGFAGGMNYVKPQIEGSLGSFISKDPLAFVHRVMQNQWKLLSINIPEIFIGKSVKLYNSDDWRFANIAFLLFSLFPLFVLLYGIYEINKREKTFLFLSSAFFLPALIFFTLFFTLNRYFLIFLPLLIIFFVIGTGTLLKGYRYLVIGNYLSLLLLSTFVYYNTESPKDEFYSLKKEAGEWLTLTPTLSQREKESLKIMERFPIVTYYSNTKTRYITPYTDNIQDIHDYGVYNDIDILIIDTMDFQTYRPQLKKYLSESPQNFRLLKEFVNTKGQKVILYTLKKSL